MGNQTVQLFAKSIMPLFPFVTLLMFLDLALSERSFGALVGLVVSRYMIKKFLGEYIAEGYVDTALMFFGFLTIYNLIKLQHISDTAEQVRQIIAGVIFASGAALTKTGRFIYAAGVSYSGVGYMASGSNLLMPGSYDALSGAPC